MAALGWTATASELNVIRRQIEPCWHIPAGTRDVENLVIYIAVVMSPDGTVRRAEIVDRARWHAILSSGRLACEISVTSTPEQELGNVAKCLAAGYDEIVVIASEPKRLRTLERFVSANLGEEDKGRVRFLVPEAFIAYLDEIETTPETREEVVRGYTVSVTYTKVDAAEAEAKRKAVAQVIARSVRQMKDEPSSAP